MNVLDKFRVLRRHIGLIRRPITELLDGFCDREIEWLRITPEPQVAADPFGLIRNGRLHVFFEFKPYEQLDAFIAHVEVDLNGRPSTAQPVLKLSHHLSYPCLFEFRGELYMVPETAQAREVSLYRCTRFPDCWEKAAVILPGVVSVDSTVFQWEGRWWLSGAGGPNSAELSLWHAMDPRGPWRPHPRNPVKVDLASSRPAGTPFIRGDVLFRPAMDNVGGYGKRIVLNRVTVLSPDEFDEEPATWLEPTAGSFCPMGRHHLAAVGSFTLVDGSRKSLLTNPVKLAQKLRTKFVPAKRASPGT